MNPIATPVILGAVGESRYWLNLISGVDLECCAIDYYSDALAKIYIGGRILQAKYFGYVAAVLPTGELYWQKSIQTALRALEIESMVVDGLGRLVCVGNDDAAPGFYKGYIVRFDRTGAKNQFELLFNPSTGDDSFSCIAYGGFPTPQLYIGGYQRPANTVLQGQSDMCTLKYDALATTSSTNSGRLWYSAFGGVGSDYISAITTTGDQVIVAGTSYGNASGTLRGYIRAMSQNSGSMTWERTITSTATPQLDEILAMAASAEYICVLGISLNGYFCGVIDATGRLVWLRKFPNLQILSFSATVAEVPGDSRAFIVGFTVVNYTDPANPEIVQPFIITKYSHLGTVIWRRALYEIGTSDTLRQAREIKVDSLGDMVIVGAGYVLKLPADGSLTGTYSFVDPNGNANTLGYKAIALTEVVATDYQFGVPGLTIQNPYPSPTVSANNPDVGVTANSTITNLG